ncbi:MAG: TerB family tellurite resistance protein [Methylobacteriaceae bacterium]|nr:TerB family tellurite resistance protein [Methylobacteriaceae bacterium]
MLHALKSLLADLSGQAGPRFGPRDQRVAAAVLLTHLVGVDGEVNAVEKTRLLELLKDRFALDDAGAQALVRQALASERESIDFEEFTALLSRTLDERGRRDLVDMMWDMARADGKVTEFEESAIWRVARQLGVLDPGAFAAQAMRKPEG